MNDGKSPFLIGCYYYCQINNQTFIKEWYGIFLLSYCEVRYWSSSCGSCELKLKCTTGKERRISRWEHGKVLEVHEERMNQNPTMMQLRKQTVEHPFGTIKSWMGISHFKTRTLQRVSTEMSLHVLAYNMTRMINIMGMKPLMRAIEA